MSDEMRQDPCSGCASRREFLKITAGAVALGAAGGLLEGCGELAGGDVLTEDLVLVLSEHPELAVEGQSLLVDAGIKSPIAVTRTGPQDFVVTGTECNHAGCSVRREGAAWRCPCHGSTFALEGGLTKGPATADLAVYDFALEGDRLTIFGK